MFAGQFHEREFLRVEQQQVGGEPAEVLHQQREFENQRGLGLAARNLHRRDRVVDLVEAEQLAGGFAVDGQPGHAVAGGAAERILRDAPAGRGDALRRRRGSPPRSRRPTGAPNSASPAACGCSRAARCRPPAGRASASASATASAPRCRSAAASSRYRRSAVSSWSLRERPRWTRLPASPIFSREPALQRGVRRPRPRGRCASRRRHG